VPSLTAAEVSIGATVASRYHLLSGRRICPSRQLWRLRCVMPLGDCEQGPPGCSTAGLCDPQMWWVASSPCLTVSNIRGC